MNVNNPINWLPRGFTSWNEFLEAIKAENPNFHKSIVVEHRSSGRLEGIYATADLIRYAKEEAEQGERDYEALLKSEEEIGIELANEIYWRHNIPPMNF